MLLNEVFIRIKKGVEIATDPFRFFVFSTIAGDGAPASRTVVLRNVDATGNLTFFTDLRSQKSTELEANAKASALFYDPDQRLQIRMTGLAEASSDTERCEWYWQTMGIKNPRDYTTALAPGTEIDSELPIEQLEHRHYFAMVELMPTVIDIVQLDRVQHKRWRFTKHGKEWVTTRLVP